MGRTVKTEAIVLWLCVALIAIAGLAPIAAIAFESFRYNGHFSLNYYRELTSTARFWPLLGNSIRLALATTAVCGLIGVPAGILFAKSDLPLRAGFMWLATVPFVLLLEMGELSVPSFLRYPVLPVLSFTQFTASYNFGAATAAAVPLAVIAFVGVLVESVFLRDRDYRFQSTGQTLFISLRHWKNPLAALMAALCFALVILPLSALSADAFSLAAMHEAMQRAGASVVRSVMYSAVASTILTALGFLLGHVMLSRSRERRILNFLTLALFAIPGTVLSIGLVRLWNTPSTWFIYATPALLILGYTAQYCAVTTRLSLAGLMLIPVSLDEAGRLSGAAWARRLFWISIPLSARTLV